MRFWRFMRFGPALTLMAFGGCARIQGNLDLLLSPGAVGNALRLPYSSVSGIATFFGRLLS